MIKEDVSFSHIRNPGVNIEYGKKFFVKYIEWCAHLLPWLSLLSWQWSSLLKLEENCQKASEFYFQSRKSVLSFLLSVWRENRGIPFHSGLAHRLNA